MSVELLDKTRKINKLLHNNNSHKVVFNDICKVLSEILLSNILVISKKGKVLGVSICPGVDEIHELIEDKVGGYVDKMFNERLLSVLSTKENVNLQKFYMENHKTEELLEMDNEFHKYLFQFTNKIEIYNLMKNFDIHFDRIRSVSIRSVKNLKIVEDHEKILDCIRNSDEEEASKIMNIHLMRDKIDKEELKEKYGRYFK